MRNQRGFSLIETLVVIGVVALLASIVVVAVNPAEQFARSRNAQRVAGLNFLASAIFQNIIDNRGDFVCSAGALPAEEAMIASLIDDPTGQPIYNLAFCLIPMYTDELPVDPNFGGAYWNSQRDYYSSYVVQQRVDGRVMISAPGAELGQEISVTR